MKILFKAETIKPDGSIIKAPFQIGNTLVMNYFNMMHVQLNYLGTTIKDTGGTNRTVSPHSNNFNLKASAADAAYGLVMGTSDTAYSNDHYSLQGKINHGSSAGQLLHQACICSENLTVDGNDMYFDIQRNFINSSGSAITYKEIGLYVYGYSTYRIMIERTLSEDTIANGDGKIITYRFQKTYT